MTAYTIYYRTEQENLLTHKPLVCKGSIVIEDQPTEEAALAEARFILEAEADVVVVSTTPLDDRA